MERAPLEHPSSGSFKDLHLQKFMTVHVDRSERDGKFLCLQGQAPEMVYIFIIFNIIIIIPIKVGLEKEPNIYEVSTS